MASTAKFDDIFLGILQHCGKIELFLDAIFNFLSRRTDYFHLMHKKDDKLGFPPGVAEKMMIKIFEKYQGRVLKNDPIYMKWKESKKEKGENKENNDNETKHEKSGDMSVDSEVTVSTSKVTEDSTIKPCPDVVDVPSEKSTPDETKSSEETSSDSKISNTETDNDCFNGGKTEKYSWSQTLTDVDVKIQVPSFIKASKELSVEIKSQYINVALKMDPPSDSGLTSRVLVSGKLKEKIRCDESMWSLMPREHISINLEKFQQKWWDCVLEGDDEIDKSNIDTTTDVQDFDEQTQSDIRKVMYDQQQKMMGKPTSDEQKTHKLLEKAWDAEGSPFKGTPFDPSKVNLSGDGM